MNKNKHEMSDDELDRLFSESAEKMEFDFDPDSWTKMSQKLDAAALPPSSVRGTSPWAKRSLLLLIGLLVFVGGYFLLNPSPNQSNETPTNKAKASENEQTAIHSKKYVETSKVYTDNSKSNENTSETIKNTKSSQTDFTTKNSETLVHNDIKVSRKTSSESNKTTDNDKIELRREVAKENGKSDFVFKNEEVLAQNTKTRNANTHSSKVLIATNRNHNLGETKEVSTKTTLPKSKNSSIESQTLSNPAVNSSTENLNNVNQTNISVSIDATIEQNRLTFNNLGLLSPKSTHIKSSINLPNIAFESPQKESPIIPKITPQSFKKGLYFRIGVSPDMSLVTTDELTKFGSNLALLLEYRFNNRLSIQSGVLRSMKYYDAYPESYEWPYNWPTPPKLIDINATCKMLDIPLNIRYDISQRQLSRWFVSAGATSYIMLNEKYVYNYENPSDPKIKWKTWEGKTGPYYLGVLNFSMGYEYQLFRKLSIQAEPFFKLPIAHVGFGQVNLSTLGLLVSAKYPISIRK